MRDLNALQVFVRVAEARSFKRAAEQLALTPSAVSKAITRLEDDLGLRLLHRTTRSVATTNEGSSFLERCRAILSEIDEAEASLAQTRDVPQGRLRVQMPVGLGRRVVVPALRAFAARHPGIVVDAELSDRIADPIHEGLDAAIVLGDLADARLVARELCTLRFMACASPSYLERHGEPASPDDLDRHHCLAYVLPQTGRYRDWVFVKDGRTHVKTVSGRLNVNNAESLLESAIAGAGIVMLSTFIVEEALREGRLVPVLRDHEALGPRVHVVYPPNRSLSARVRAFVRFLQETVDRHEALGERPKGRSVGTAAP